MNRVETVAVELLNPNLCPIREHVKTLIESLKSKWELWEQAHKEIEPELTKRRLAEKLIDRIGRAEYIPDRENPGSKYVYMYGSGNIDKTDLAAVNSPVFEMINKIKEISHESKVLDNAGVCRGDDSSIETVLRSFPFKAMM